MPDPTRTLATFPTEISPRTRLAAAAFLSRYGGVTLTGYTFSLQILFRWLILYGVDPIDANRPQLELYVRQHLIAERAITPNSISHHMTAVRGFYRLALIDDVIAKDPAVAVRTPRVFRDPYRDDYLTAQELRAVIAASRRSGRPSDQGMVALLTLLGLRISEVLSVRIEDYQDVVQGHRVLRLIGKGAKPATMPLTVAVIRMLDVAAGGRETGPLLLRETSSVYTHVGEPFTYRSARLALQRLAADAGIERRITPHMCRRGWVTAGLDQGVSMRDMQIAARHEDPRTTARYDRGALNLDRSAIHVLSANLAGAA